MKKVTLILASISIMIIAACNDKKEITEKTVIIEKEATTPAEDEENDGTSLSISNDGVEFSTKNGDNKTEVEIETDGKKK
jgi:carbon starvation protein CstA